MSNTAPSAFELTDAQLVLLSAASHSEDGLVVLTDDHPSVARAIAALLRKELLIELVGQRLQPHWRHRSRRRRCGDPEALGGKINEMLSTDE